MGSPIQEFYKNRSVFITGGTGFVGKVLCEKLLRSCPDIGHIYVLLRSRPNKPIEQRLEEEIFNSTAFSLIPSLKKKAQKIIAISGDITEPGLGVSEEDKQTLIDNVSVVFHSAASVKFHGPIKDFIDQNVFGTDSVMKLCCELTNLEALVYVSTAYSNCQRLEINEEVYKLRESAANTLKKLALSTDSALELDASATKELREGRPNAYTYSKAIAENLVNEQYSHLPVVIVRPSIVTSSMKEPAPGWVDNVNGVAGAFLLGSLGIARTMDIHSDATADVIPVDIICNSLIAIGWHSVTHTNQRKRVIHLTSGHHNPVKWGHLLQYSRNGALECPSMRVVRPIAKQPTTTRGAFGRINHLTKKFVSEILFAHFIDMILAILGYKRFMVKIIGKLHRAFALLEPFTTKEWYFHNDNYYDIYDQMSEEDQKIFFSDVRKIEWKEYGADLYFGIRRYLLKESDSTVEKAKQRLTLITVLYFSFQLFLFLSFISLIYFLFVR